MDRPNPASPLALAVAYAATGDSAAAGDITQDAFLRAWTRLPDLVDPAKFPAWLCLITRNLAHDHARSRRAEATHRSAAGAPDPPDLTTPAGWSAAVHSYNHSDAYVRAVLGAADAYAARSGG